ncbi:MAG: hypothetical protein OYH77_07000 [Pseudomonadota bacterium]|nr:hypothetical protein [Pseudomonadota bacterium]
MKRLAALLLPLSSLCACIETAPDQGSDLHRTASGDTYLKTVFDDFGVRKNDAFNDTKYPTALHYLSYLPRVMALEIPMTLTGVDYTDTDGVFKFQDILLSYQKDNKTYTCRLQDMPFASETAFTEQSDCFISEVNKDNDVHRFINMCKAHGSIAFHDNSRDFSCQIQANTCQADDCRIAVNAACVFAGDSASGFCQEVKMIWEATKDTGSNSLSFVEYVRKKATSCSFANSTLTCVVKAEASDDDAEAQASLLCAGEGDTAGNMVLCQEG